jgi:hypothetical protein
MTPPWPGEEHGHSVVKGLWLSHGAVVSGRNLAHNIPYELDYLCPAIFFDLDAPMVDGKRSHQGLRCATTSTSAAGPRRVERSL